VTKTEANTILDESKHGIWHPRETVTRALIATGDISTHCGTLYENGLESPYVRTRQVYGEAAYERTFGIVQGFGQGCEIKIGETA
jgi:hypothetical protein